MQLIYNTGKIVAYKVKTAAPKTYCVNPNHGIVLPYSIANITVTMLAQKEAPPDLKCRDKFPIQSVITHPQSTIKDIPSEMFKKACVHRVDEYKFRVVFVLPPIVCGVSKEGSENTSRTLLQTLLELTQANAEISKVRDEKMKLREEQGFTSQLNNLQQEINLLRVAINKPEEDSCIPAVLMVIGLLIVRIVSGWL